jgi:hypothetical protein
MHDRAGRRNASSTYEECKPQEKALNGSVIDLDGKSRHHEVADALLL